MENYFILFLLFIEKKICRLINLLNNVVMFIINNFKVLNFIINFLIMIVIFN